jgi:hypothetical protein
MSFPFAINSTADMVHFSHYRWWADRGLIHWEHKTTGDYGTMPVRMCLIRLRALNDMVENSIPESHEMGPKFFYSDEVSVHQKYIDEMIQLCNRAREQGTPDDPSAARDLKRRRRKVVHIPGAREKF